MLEEGSFRREIPKTMQHPIFEPTKGLRTRMILTPSRSTCKQTRTPQIPLSEDSQKRIQTRNSSHFL
ncbi:hypothetical protein BDV06DRAFT_182623 [Aspergillus oleicola]